MKTRQVVLPDGLRFDVPQHVQRIDHRGTHGWQLRYGGTKLYSDGAEGARTSFRRATDELRARIARLPAPSKLQRAPNRNKASGLPVGISGPVVRQRGEARVRECSFSVSLPRFGERPLRSSVYIGTENTYTKARWREALAKAVELRTEAETAYARAATKAKRAASRALQEPAKPKPSPASAKAPRARAR